MELISALAADDWTSVPFVADFDRMLGLEKLVGFNSDVLGETDFMGFDDRVTVQNLEIIKNFLLTRISVDRFLSYVYRPSRNIILQKFSE